jgi:hypothetical protein
VYFEDRGHAIFAPLVQRFRAWDHSSDCVFRGRTTEAAGVEAGELGVYDRGEGRWN